MLEQKAEFGQYYEQFQPNIYKYFYHHTGNIWHSEDLTQEVFLKGFKAIDRYKPTGIPILAWFQVIAHNLLVDYYKGQNPYSLDALILLPANSNPHAPTLGETLEDRNERVEPVIQSEQHFMADKLRQGIAQLSPYYRQAFSMYYLDQLSYKEIAEKLNKPQGSIRVANYRSMKQLRGIIDDEI